ncbi:MAG TPA: efflux RND transporter periplasmic adaptor subunit [Planctomycetota bacterium]|nr:efflux RND transporter periplasmic adaptor subunit [Planctomycetota bacterium]
MVGRWKILFAAVAIAGCGDSTKNQAKAPPPPAAVKVAPVIQRTIPLLIENVGQTRGSVEVEIRARVEGFLDRVAFEEGRPVKQGDLLYEIDPKPFKAALDRSKSDLATAEAAHSKARNDVARFKPLVEKNAISRQEFDTSVSMEEAAAARVEAAKANVRSAELDLSYCTIHSPIDGLAGKTEVKAGALVGRGQSTLLTTVSTIDPIRARFYLSERDYLTVVRRYRETPEEGKGTEAHFEMVLSDGSLHPHKGSFVFIERLVDPTTGTIMVEVNFPNPEKIVRPGQFARVRVPIDVIKDAILVPQRAVTELQATWSVAAVSKDNKVEMRPVKIGIRFGNLWQIESGLKPDDRIIVEGLQKVRNGVTVNPTPVDLDDQGAEKKADAPSKPPEATPPSGH